MFCDQCGTRLEPTGSAAAPPACPRCTSPAPSVSQRAAQVRLPFPGTGRATTVLGAMRRASARNVRGNLTALFSAWFNVPFILLMAGFGAILGGIGGIGSGTMTGAGLLSRIDVVLTFVLPLPIDAADLLPTAAFQIGGIIGAMLGAVSGGLTMAIAVFIGFYQLLYEGDPTWPWAVAAGQIVTALFAAVSYTTYSGLTERWRLELSGARRPSRRESQWLLPLLQEASARLGAPAAPVLLIDDSREPNAYAGIRHIIVNRGLLDHLRYDEEAVSGVLAHELAHWRNGDAVAMAWGKGIALPLYIAYGFASAVERAVRWGPARLLTAILLWSVTVTVRRIVMPMQAADWRRCEYRADAAAKAAGYGEGLHRALGHLRDFDGARTGWEAAVLATHPPTELRLERLEEPGRDYPLAPFPTPVRPVKRAASTRVGPAKD